MARIRRATKVPGKLARVPFGSDLLRLITSAFAQLQRDLTRDLASVVPGISADSLVGADLLQSAIRENVNLIKTMPELSRADLAEAFRDSEGLTGPAASRLLQERFSVQESRADFWARDQALKTHADVTKLRCVEAGLDRYRWVTSRDERVRPEHAALHGRVFTWDNPPSVGAPGEDYQCRCTAYPLLPGEG
jgi:SPP1 gp7 family putative phage head morphogenesis protein